MVSQASNRNPDDNLDKSWGDWLVTAEVVLEMRDEKKEKLPKDRTTSKK